ncbi:ankyrin repeat domain-containing protein 34B-like [Brachyistius frenatus]|uniref:ankyrin repeat domain-containing protein 34B-like n=1 Tax=Brachyistius frenatus TaxID=100188 RepID=UPI0037E711BC
MGDPLSDCSPLISAVSSGKLRLVRLLVEGGAQVNGRNPRGETALLAACKALRGEPSGPEMVKLLTYLLHNKADPNAQDRAGRTALMYACMERAGAQVASTLLAAGGDPGMEDYSGASALVYAINAQNQPTLKVLMDACQAGGRDIIIIATEMGVNGGPVTRRYLNVPPSPDTSPVSCMSPSDIVLKTDPPNSPEGENFFNFRGTSKRGSNSCRKHPSSELRPLSQCSTPPPRQRISSEPRHAIHDLACLNRAYEEGMREGSLREEVSDSWRVNLGLEAPSLHVPTLSAPQEYPPLCHGGPASASPPTISDPIRLSPPSCSAGFTFQKTDRGVSASPTQLFSSSYLLRGTSETSSTPSTAPRLLRHLPGCSFCLLLR